MTQRIAASVTPQAGPLDRLFVYLTSDGPPLTWLLVSDRPRPLDASRIAPSRHSEWNLPVGGELWEIRIPEPQRKAFRLEGSRKTSSLGSGGIGLGFLPGAQELLRNRRRPVRGRTPIRCRGFRATTRANLRRAFAGRRARRKPRRPDVELRTADRLTRRQAQAKRQPSGRRSSRRARPALVPLFRWNRGRSAQGNFFPAPLPGTRPFRFSLDPAARLTWVAVNGRVVRVQHHGGTVTVPSLPSERWNRVEILYKTSSLGHRFREDRPVVVPRADDAEIFQFRWRFALPPGIQPCGNPRGTRLTETLPALSWTEKLFGPLGRPTAESQLPSLADAPWMTDFGFDSNTRPDVFAEIDPERPAPNWTVWNASADVAPRSLALAVWHEPEMRGLAWIVFLGFLSAGLAFQRWEVRFRLPLGFAIVAAAAALSLVASGLYSLPLGACVSGILLSILVWGLRFARPAAASRGEERSFTPGEHGQLRISVNRLAAGNWRGLHGRRLGIRHLF